MNKKAKQVWDYITAQQDGTTGALIDHIAKTWSVSIDIASEAIWKWATGDDNWFNQTFK